MATMKVETFEVEEVTSDQSHPEVEQAAVDLIESLGLTGQRKLVIGEKNTDSSNTAVATQTRIPFRKMTAQEFFVYSTLCPQQEPLREYDSSPIPLRVLQVAAQVKEAGYFSTLYVWSAKSAEVKDPVLVGYLAGDYEWDKSKAFILARWAEMLDEMPAMLKKAYSINRDVVLSTLREIANKVATDIATVELIRDGEPMNDTGIPAYNR